MKLNILIAVPNDSLGGAEQFLKNICLYYSNFGHTVIVCFLKKRSSEGWIDLNTQDNIKLIYTDSVSERRGVIPFITNIIRLENKDFDYIYTSHVHLTGLMGILIKSGLITKRFFIGRESTSIFKRFKGLKLLGFKLHYFLGYTELDLLICQTTFMKNQLESALPNLSKKVDIKVMANPINLSLIKDTISKSAKFDVPFDDFIISAGRLIPEKGFDILINSFKGILPDYPNMKLVILGEGNMRRELEHHIQNLNLTKNVFLIGHVKNVYTYFEKALACIVASRIEGFPNVLLQMMSQNSKVISTMCAGGIDEIPGIFVCDAGNDEQLQRCIRQALETNTQDRREKFDQFLSERSIEQFVSTVEAIVKNG